jgi:hypothetical protein
MKATMPACLALALAALALSGCQQPSGTASTSAVPAGTAPVIAPPQTAPAPASTAPLPGDNVSTPHYKIAIALPTLPADEASLAAAMRTTADNAKREFLQALPDPDQLPEMADRQFALVLDFKLVAATPAFTSVRETGAQDTGGAHPIPIQAAFVYDRKHNRQIALDDLFTQPDAARKALANFAHDVLLKKFMANAPKAGEGSPAALREWKSNMLQMLDGGTRPTTVNYSVFVVRAGAMQDAASPGLTLIFPPYQVAPYVEGAQTVDVPARVFARFLRADYQSAFSTL